MNGTVVKTNKVLIFSENRNKHSSSTVTQYCLKMITQFPTSTILSVYKKCLCVYCAHVQVFLTVVLQHASL